jgi:hypothetical protein
MLKRRRFKQQLTLQDRLSAWVKQVKEDAARLPPGPERDALLKKARQAELANHLQDWVKPTGRNRRNSSAAASSLPDRS